jgi:hypothetical protein
MTIKSKKNQHFLHFFVLVLFFLVNSCYISTKNERFECKWSPDYERIADEALNSMDDIKRIEIQMMKARCNF